MYCWYLRNTYLENNLKKPGKLVNCGVPVDLGTVEVPIFVVATREDHIVPWRSAYKTLHLFKSKKREFILGASGHIAGIVNPPDKKRRSHWVFEEQPQNPDAGFDAAQEVKGSWWPRWSQWLATHAGGKRGAPKQAGNKTYKPLEAAPGRYVRERIH
jgi:polyhydroxyalkanoate synthase